MAFNFPNSPNPGDTFQPVGGPAYQWDGQKWVMAGSPITWTPAYDQRNRIVNGAMQISQENGNTGGSTSNYYMADQWLISSGGTPLTTWSRVQVTTPRGSVNRLRAVVNTATASPASSEYWTFATWIEGIRIADFQWGGSSAKNVILRFGWKSPAGTYSISFRTPATAFCYVANFTISAAQANTDTEQTFIVPGHTAGTWPKDNTAGLLIRIVFASGSGQLVTGGSWQSGNGLITSSNTNGVATVNNTFELFDVGLYLDPTGSGIPPAWEMPDEAEELRACQRYFQSSYAVGDVTGNTGVTVATHVNFKPVMRTAPTMGFTATTFPTTNITGLSVNGGSAAAYISGTITTTGRGYYYGNVTGIARM